MGRHFRKSTRYERLLKLLLLLLLTASAVFVAGSFLVRDFDGESTPAVTPAPVAKTIEKKEPDAAPGDAEPADTSQEPDEESVKPEEDRDKPVVTDNGKKPVLALIVDDGGNQTDLAKRLAATGLPLTWAIIPYTRSASETARLADSKRIPYLVHLPMQAQSDKDGSSDYMVGRGLTPEQITDITKKALDSLPGAIGINNHRGSLATSIVEIMEPVIYELKERGLIFVDSRTSEKSVAYNVAVINGVPALRNRGFLDGSPEKSEIEKRFNEIVRLAEKRGDAIAICHFRPATVAFLESLAARKNSLPVRLVTIPEMKEILKERSY